MQEPLRAGGHGLLRVHASQWPSHQPCVIGFSLGLMLSAGIHAIACFSLLQKPLPGVNVHLQGDDLLRPQIKGSL